MRITLFTIGTLGDTQPFVALAVRLRQDGHRVTLAARPDFAGLAAAYGVDFAPLGHPYQPFITGAGLRSGVPAVLTPLLADQPSWARQVYALGAGPAPLPFQTLTA